MKGNSRKNQDGLYRFIVIVFSSQCLTGKVAKIVVCTSLSDVLPSEAKVNIFIRVDAKHKS